MSGKTVFLMAVVVCACAVSAGCGRARARALAEEQAALARTEAAKAVLTAGPLKIVLDSEGTQGIETTGDWPDGLGGEDHGTACRFAFKGNGECKFVWRPDLPKAGDYRVSVWFGGDPNSDHATDSPFTVVYAEGRKTVNVDQTKSSGGWKALGIFPFNQGKSGYVELTNKANGNVVADAVQFELVK